jgi:hypothetical protein
VRRAVVILFAPLLVAASAAAGPRCDGGAFVIHMGPRLIASATGTHDVVLVSPPASVALVGACTPTRLRGRGGRVVASWPKHACGDARRVRLRATFDADCQTLLGLVRAAGSRPVRFAASRCADDGIVDATAGEECAAGDGCGPGRACVDCRCVPTVSFTSDVEPIFRNCLGTACHAGTFPPGGFSLEPGLAYDALHGHVARSGACAGWPTIVPGVPDASALFARVGGFACGTRMPSGSPALAPDQVDTIRWWIAEGARADD